MIQEQDVSGFGALGENNKKQSELPNVLPSHEKKSRGGVAIYSSYDLHY